MKLHFLEQEWPIRALRAAKGSSALWAWSHSKWGAGRGVRSRHIKVNTPSIPVKKWEKQRLCILVHVLACLSSNWMDLGEPLLRQSGESKLPPQSDVSPHKYPNFPQGLAMVFQTVLFYVENRFMYSCATCTTKTLKDETCLMDCNSLHLPTVCWRRGNEQAR